MSKKAHEYLIEAMLIVFSVILALFLNEYRNNLKAKNEVEKTLVNLTTEIENNREILKKFMPYHQGGAARLASIAENDSAINALERPLIYGVLYFHREL